MKVLNLLLVALLLASVSLAENKTDGDKDAQRFQLMEIKQGFASTTIYKIDTQTGETWVMVNGANAFLPMKSFNLSGMKKSDLEAAKNARCAEEFLKATDSFVPDECQ